MRLGWLASRPASPPPTPAATGPAEELHHSLALPSLLRELERRERPAVLDLGRASGTNVTLLSRFGCRLTIADLFATLDEHGAARGFDHPRFPDLLAEALAYPADLRFDVILAWDLLDYFERAQLELLGARLAALARPGALLFALVSFRGLLPELPRELTIVDGQTLRSPAAPGKRPSPLHKEPELCRLLPGFRTESSFLLRDGMQEYLLRLPRPGEEVTPAPERSGPRAGPAMPVSPRPLPGGGRVLPPPSPLRARPVRRSG